MSGYLPTTKLTAAQANPGFAARGPFAPAYTPEEQALKLAYDGASQLARSLLQPNLKDPGFFTGREFDQAVLDAKRQGAAVEGDVEYADLDRTGFESDLT